MRNSTIILAILLALSSVELQAQTKSIVGLWEFTEEKIILEFTENQYGTYGSNEKIDYKIVGNKFFSPEKFPEDEGGADIEFLDANTLILTVEDDEKVVGQRIVPSINSTLKPGIYLAFDDDFFYVDIRNETYAEVGGTSHYDFMKYLTSGSKLYLLGSEENGRYFLFEIKDEQTIQLFDTEHNKYDLKRVSYDEFYENKKDYWEKKYAELEVDTVETVQATEEIEDYIVAVDTAVAVVEDVANKKSFEVSYASSGHTTKYIFDHFGIDKGDFVSVVLWEENYKNERFSSGSNGYYYFYFDSDEIQIITIAGETDNLLETNPPEWVTAFRKFADEVLIMVAERDENERRYWKTGELLEKTALKKMTFSVLDNEIELREGGSFPCVVHEIWGSSSYFEIKRRDGKYVIEGRKYKTIDDGIEEYFRYDFFRYYYKDDEQWKKVWETFVKDGSLQKVIDFINEIIDDEFLDLPINTTYG